MSKFKLEAIHSGEEIIKDYGFFDTMDDAYLKIAEIDGEDAMDNPQWPEGCDAVVTDTETGESWFLECDAWTALTNFPVKVKMSRTAMDELHSCEYGSYEDHIVNAQCKHCKGIGKFPCYGGDQPCPKCKGAKHVVERRDPYDDGTLHIVEILERSPYKTVVYLENQAEVDEFFGQALTGTFGLYHLNTALRLYRELLPHVSVEAAKAVRPGSIGY